MLYETVHFQLTAMACQGKTKKIGKEAENYSGNLFYQFFKTNNNKRRHTNN